MTDFETVLASIKNPRFRVDSNGVVQDVACLADALRCAIEAAPAVATPQTVWDSRMGRERSAVGAVVGFTVTDANENRPFVSAYIDLPPCHRAQAPWVIADESFTWILSTRPVDDRPSECTKSQADFKAMMSRYLSPGPPVCETTDLTTVLASIKNPRFRVHANGVVQDVACFADAFQRALEAGPAAACPTYTQDPHTGRNYFDAESVVGLTVVDANENWPFVNAFINLPVSRYARAWELIAIGCFNWVIFFSMSARDTPMKLTLYARDFKHVMSAFA
jgi:hypothetical protein